MIEFDFYFFGSLNSDILSGFFDFMPNIERLCLNAIYLSKFSLDRFVDLKVLTIIGKIEDDFNIGLFNNICNQLEQLKFVCDIDNKGLAKLFSQISHFYHSQFYKN